MLSRRVKARSCRLLKNRVDFCEGSGPGPEEASSKPLAWLVDGPDSTFGPGGAAAQTRQKQSKAMNADEFADYSDRPFVLYC